MAHDTSILAKCGRARGKCAFSQLCGLEERSREAHIEARRHRQPHTHGPRPPPRGTAIMPLLVPRLRAWSTPWGCRRARVVARMVTASAYHAASSLRRRLCCARTQRQSARLGRFGPLVTSHRRASSPSRTVRARRHRHAAATRPAEQSRGQIPRRARAGGATPRGASTS